MHVICAHTHTHTFSVQFVLNMCLGRWFWRRKMSKNWRCFRIFGMSLGMFWDGFGSVWAVFASCLGVVPRIPRRTLLLFLGENTSLWNLSRPLYPTDGGRVLPVGCFHRGDLQYRIYYIHDMYIYIYNIIKCVPCIVSYVT